MEWFPPFFSLEKGKGISKVFIICGGMPGVPNKQKLMEFLAKKGYWVLFPRYRGTWESSGRFLDHDPYKDVIDVIDALSTPFISAFSGEQGQILQPEVYIIGGSFGGPAAMLASSDARVKKVVTVAGVVDWTVSGEEEHMDDLLHMVKDGFGEAYRFDDAAWQELSQGMFYNPVTMGDLIDYKKVLMIHAKDDMVVPHGTSESFARKNNISFISTKKGGHLSTSILTRWSLWRKVKKYLAL